MERYREPDLSEISGRESLFQNYTRGIPPKWNSFIKKLCILTCFKLQSPSRYSPFDVTHLLRHFFPLLKTVFELVSLDSF